MQAQPYRRRREDARVETAVSGHGRTPLMTLPILQSVQQAEGGSLNRNALGAIADALHLNDARVLGVASFYSLLSTQPRAAKVLRLCDGPVCRLVADETRRAEVESAAAAKGWGMERCSCLGLCDGAPAALLGQEPCAPVSVKHLDNVAGGQYRTLPTYAAPVPGEVRVTMARVGRIDPESIGSALEAGAYQALLAVLAQGPDSVLQMIDLAGLRGCGGAGFPTARKWRMVAEARDSEKFVVCNADESEPGTFKDRVLMDADPHLLLEGMALAGYSVGAGEGIIYLRGEYEWIARRLERAIGQAIECGRLGENIQGSGFSFRVHVHRGAGAYICGEETALLESLEGKRGEPRVRPPYPTTAGYLGKPTLINNVETLCLVPPIISRGADWFRTLGTPDSPGTKVFTLTGCINRPGAYEAPLGVTLRQLIEQFGGGIRAGSRFKAALTGGAAGQFAPASALDVLIDFNSSKQGVSLGSGAMFILDETVPVPAVLVWLLHFFEVESCGKCTPCREGTREVRLLSDRLARGRGSPSDPGELRRLAHLMNLTSLCGLGQSVALPVESALRYFGDEFNRDTEG